MKNLIATLTSAVSKTVLFTAAVVMVGLSFALVGTLALFALIAAGIGMIAAPFAVRAQAASTDADIVA
jgi:hypothetical protein